MFGTVGWFIRVSSSFYSCKANRIRACILKASGLYSIVSNVNIINNKQYSQHKLGTDPKCKDAPVYIETIHTDESGKRFKYSKSSCKGNHLDGQIEYHNKNREERRGVAENRVIEPTFLDMLQQPDAVCKPKKKGIGKVFRLSPPGPRYKWFQVFISGEMGCNSETLTFQMTGFK